MNDRGAATVDELYLRLDCFLLPLERNEICQILESARREGLVSEVADRRDGYGEAVEEQWTTTEKGAKLRRPRAFALPDLSRLLFDRRDRATKFFDMGKTVVTMAVPIFALVGIEQSDASDLARWAAFTGVGIVLGWLVLYGLRAELDLRAAADSWPRLQEEREARWEFQMDWTRTAYLPSVLAAVYIATGLGLGFGFPTAWWISTAVAALALGVLYLVHVRPLYRAWRQNDPSLCRAKWTTRGDEVAAAGGVPQTYRPATVESDGGKPAQGEVAEQPVGGA